MRPIVTRQTKPGIIRRLDHTPNGTELAYGALDRGKKHSVHQQYQIKKAFATRGRIMDQEGIPASDSGSVSKSLRNAIRERGLTAYAAAKLAGVSVDAIQRFLNRQRGLTLSTVDKLANSLGLTLCPDSPHDEQRGENAS